MIWWFNILLFRIANFICNEPSSCRAFLGQDLSVELGQMNWPTLNVGYAVRFKLTRMCCGLKGLDLF